MKKFTKSFLGILLVLTVLLSGCTNTNVPDENISKVDPIETEQNIVTESTTPEPKEEPSKPVVEKKKLIFLLFLSFLVPHMLQSIITNLHLHKKK